MLRCWQRPEAKATTARQATAELAVDVLDRQLAAVDLHDDAPSVAT